MHPNRYMVRKIPKRGGGFRQIEEPTPALKIEQKRILREVLNKLPVPGCVHGFRYSRSPVTNARAHAGRKYLLQLDLKDFFPSCTTTMIYHALRYYKIPPSEARRITYICTYGNRLPQGAPTSPALANLCASRLDARLQGLAKKYDAVYTRYADDLTFSMNSAKYLYMLKNAVVRIVQSEGFKLNRKKTRITRPGQQHRVTGLVIGDDGQIRVPRKERRRFRARIHQNDRIESLQGFAAWIYAANPQQGEIAFKKVKGVKYAKTREEDQNHVAEPPQASDSPACRA